VKGQNDVPTGHSPSPFPLSDPLVQTPASVQGKNKKQKIGATGTHPTTQTRLRLMHSQEIKFGSANLSLLPQAEVLLQLKMLKKAVLQLALSPSMQEPLPSAA